MMVMLPMQLFFSVTDGFIKRCQNPLLAAVTSTVQVANGLSRNRKEAPGAIFKTSHSEAFKTKHID
jgi:hypothetical protein